MSVDFMRHFRPGGITPAELAEWHAHFQSHAGHMASADLIRQVVVPLHDAWLKANPPCPTRGFMEGSRHWVITGGNEYRLHDGTWVKPCPDCPESPGVLPFDKWTAGLVALWTAVHGDDPIMVMPKGGNAWDIIAATRIALRQIGGVR